MTPHLQAKLLHVLQDSEYSRLGGKRTVHVDARVLASTNVHLEEHVANGKFREDLYFRLNVIRVDIPPLRERREDIPVLCNYFLCRYRDRYKSTVEEISPSIAGFLSPIRLARKRAPAREFNKTLPHSAGHEYESV